MHLRTRSEYVDKCRELGYGETKKVRNERIARSSACLELSPLTLNGLQLQEEVVGTSYLAATYLKNINFKDKVYVIGSKAVCQELDEAGIQHTGVGVSHILNKNSFRNDMC